MIHVLSHLLNKTDVPPNWGKILADRRWVASFQSMPSDMIRAGRQAGWYGGSCHNKGSREGAGEAGGWEGKRATGNATTRAMIAANKTGQPTNDCRKQNREAIGILPPCPVASRQSLPIMAYSSPLISHSCTIPIRRQHSLSQTVCWNLKRFGI